MASGIITDNTGKLIAFIESRSEQKLNGIGDKIVDMAQILCPVRDGNLKASIHKVVLKTRVKVIADAKNSSGKSYAYYVETGTGRGPAQPFMQPALMAAQSFIQKSFSNWKYI